VGAVFVWLRLAFGVHRHGLLSLTNREKERPLARSGAWPPACAQLIFSLLLCAGDDRGASAEAKKTERD
jgi:hypothetical protein